MSYNRPFETRESSIDGRSFLFSNEYPMIRFLESNGYDVAYSTGVDTDRFGSLIQNHKVFLSVGHDEYWSGQQRANVEAARDAGVNLAFFSGNEVYWKTRWESSIDGTGTPYRTLVTYKETQANAKIDPSPAVDRNVARRPVQPALRRGSTGERTHRHHVYRRVLHVGDRGPRGRRQDAALAQHRHRARSPRVTSPRSPTARSATSGTRTSRTARVPPGSSDCRRRREQWTSTSSTTAARSSPGRPPIT